jgi:uncharacterized repeat protein (TIGR03943 family)
MTVDPVRVVRAAALFGWAGFFVYLWRSGHSVDYVGRRTGWVVPFGAIVLSATALGYLATLRTSGGRRRPSPSEIAGTAALVAPLLVVFMVPSPTLGALAADRKGAGDDARRAIPPPGSNNDRPISLADIAWAASVPEFRSSRGIHEGTVVEFSGLVSEASYGSITVTRFQITCCAADAVPYSAQVTGRGVGNQAKKDGWVQVRGTIRLNGDKLTVQSQSVKQIAQPDDPYAQY